MKNYKLTSILLLLIFIQDCSDKSKNKESIVNAALLAALPKINTVDIPNLGTETFSGNTTNQTTPGTIYENKYLPQNFSLKIPIAPVKTENNQVDHSKCYIDQNVDSGDVASTNSRLCGVVFDQVKLELHSLFLDLALSDVRALCHNKLPKCDLTDEKVTITISEPVMRKIEQLYSFYDYVGLNSYFQYNGYDLKNGAKLPYELNIYEEIDHPDFEYRAVIKQRVLSTRGTEVEERPGAADITIYWNKTRQNILFQFHGFAEVFDYKINARRVYDYSQKDGRMNFTTELDYWSVNSDLSFRFGQSASIIECEHNEDCVQHQGIAGFFIGNDSDRNGLSSSEIYYHALRTSSGITELKGGILINSYPETGRNNETLIHKENNELLFRLEPGTVTNGWMITGNSPIQDAQQLQANYYWVNYMKTNGRLDTTLLTSEIIQEEVAPNFPKMIFWQATDNPSLPVFLNGYALSGNNLGMKMKFKNGIDNSYRSLYLSDGTRSYIQSGY